MSNKKAKLSNVNTSSSIPARSDPPMAPASPKAKPDEPKATKTTSSGIPVKIAGNGMTSIAVKGDGERRRVATDKIVHLTKAEVAYLDKVSIPYTRA